HETEKQKADCAGCHHLMETGLVESACDTCHTGSLESLDAERKLPPAEDLLPEDIEDELEITILEDEYKASKFPHKQIIKRLTDISNENTLASYFHVEETAVCAGCHHLETIEKKQMVAQCSTCHTVRKEPERETPTLLGAYHQQCLGCHKHMGGTEEEMPQDCAGCHEEKDPNQSEANQQ
ncbi:MAG: cytochrome c3 family protein, partial [Thermodesulfobacteriota bacterium]|nr:cytochrome c3 family protein [Thermodesulfobacteriota bacterium]